LGDVFIGKPEGWDQIYTQLPGRKILVRGNHDRNRSVSWWMDNGFDFACDSMIFRGMWLTHEPARTLPHGTHLNIHGHLHNIWHGFHKNDPETNWNFTRKKLYNSWQRLFAVEYTEYRPVEFDKFVNHPEKYQATGPRIVTING
jgi:calcineurin-like phosphoesterase family protein